MLEQLRIKCPSCGIILDVRNSKHEAVKRITCPNCKKTLAVDFQEEEKPVAPSKPLESLYYGEMRIALQEGVNQISLPGFDHVELKVARLKDGNSKCLVSVIKEGKPVFVNGEPLEKGDEIALAVGDKLTVGENTLIFGNSGNAIEKPKEESEKPTSEKPKKQSQLSQWVIALAALVVAVVAVVQFWPSKEEKAKPVIAQTSNIDSIGLITSFPKKTDNPKPESKAKSQEKPKTLEKTQESPKTISDYDLEKQASKGDTEAQYDLGVKLIKRGGMSNVVRGIKYLKLASNNGSSKAKTALSKAILSLQKQADAGDSISYYILKSI
jgi:hypothetical protein